MNQWRALALRCYRVVIQLREFAERNPDPVATAFEKGKIAAYEAVADLICREQGLDRQSIRGEAFDSLNDK